MTTPSRVGFVGLRIVLLGSPSITVDGAPLHVDTRKAVALLAVLAVRRDRLAREVAADLLWPGAPPDRARATLRRTLSVLTTALGDRWVGADRSSVWLDDGGDVRCDVTEVRAALAAWREHVPVHPAARVCPACLPDLRRGADLHTGRLLDGFALRDAPAFDDWVLTEDEALRRDVATALEALVGAEAAAGRPDEAMTAARRWLALDPLAEQAHRAVMHAAVAAGRRDEAVRQYRECVAVLDRELGVAPLAETTALYTAVLDGAGAPPHPTPRVPTAPVLRLPEPPTHPLVDRDEELETLRRVHADLGQDPACVVLEGEAGIGKTRVATEFVEYASARGARTVVVRCREAEAGMTCGPIADLLRDAVRHDPAWVGTLPPTVLAEVSRVVPEAVAPDVHPGPAALDTPGARQRFLDGIFASVAALVAGEVPGVVLVDDLHWADPTTVDVLVRGLHRHRGPLLLVATWRSELVAHDDPLRRALRGPASSVLALPRLTSAQVAELVAEVRPRATGLADRLFAETEGIPFFVVEYLATLEGPDLEVPPSVLDLLTARLAPLGELARQCLTAAAVIGRSFDLAMLVRTSGRSEDEVVAGVEELLARRLVEERPGRGGEVRYDFTHTKLRDVAYGAASLARRRLLHRRAAEVLVARSGGDPAAASGIAHHFALAGRDHDAAVHHLAAGRHAASLFANRLAEEHLEAALALGVDDLALVHRHLGDLHALSGRYADAAAAYDLAAAHAPDDATSATVEHRTGRLHMRWGDWARAARHLDRALALGGGDGDDCTGLRVRADRAVVSARLGDLDAACEAAEAAVREAEACGDGAAITLARNTAGLVARRRGDLQAARAHLEVALATAVATPDPAAEVAALNNLALALAEDGDVAAALDRAEAALTRCHELGDVHREAALHNNVADLLHRAGRTDEAMPHLKASARLLADVGEPARAEPEVWKLTDW